MNKCQIETLNCNIPKRGRPAQIKRAEDCGLYIAGCELCVPHPS